MGNACCAEEALKSVDKIDESKVDEGKKKLDQIPKVNGEPVCGRNGCELALSDDTPAKRLQYICDHCDGHSAAGHLGGGLQRWRCHKCDYDLCFGCQPLTAKQISNLRKKMTDEKAALVDTKAAQIQNAPGPGDEFVVEVYRTTGKELGVDVDPSDMNSLLIVEVQSTGLFAQWNEYHPDQAVKAGDRIIQVNGIRKASAAMVQEMQKNILLDVVIKRGFKKRAD